MTTALSLTNGPGTVLTAVGEIDMSNADTFAAALTSAVTVASGSPLTVDLTAVQYLDSAGLAALFAHADHIEVLTGPLLAPLLEISGLAEIAPVRRA